MDRIADVVGLGLCAPASVHPDPLFRMFANDGFQCAIVAAGVEGDGVNGFVFGSVKVQRSMEGDVLAICFVAMKGRGNDRNVELFRECGQPAHSTGGFPKKVDKNALIAGHILIQNKAEASVVFEGAKDLLHSVLARNHGYAVAGAHALGQVVTGLSFDLFYDHANIQPVLGCPGKAIFPAADMSSKDERTFSFGEDGIENFTIMNRYAGFYTSPGNSSKLKDFCEKKSEMPIDFFHHFGVLFFTLFRKNNVQVLENVFLFKLENPQQETDCSAGIGEEAGGEQSGQVVNYVKKNDHRRIQSEKFRMTGGEGTIKFKPGMISAFEVFSGISNRRLTSLDVSAEYSIARILGS